MAAREINVEKLTLEAYKPFGTFSNLINPSDEKLGAPPVEFFRDQLQIDVTPNQNWSYSCCRVEKRPFVIDILEYHSHCGEVVLPLDNDILLQVAPATANGDELPLYKYGITWSNEMTKHFNEYVKAYDDYVLKYELLNESEKLEKMFEKLSNK